MGRNSLADHVGRYVLLSEAEHAALGRIEVGERQFRRGALLRSEHGAAGEIFVVHSGWLFCSTVLEDGRRQIVRLHFRGDLLGHDSLAFTEAPDAIVALTDGEVGVVDRAAFGRLMLDHPRLAAILFAMAQIDRVALTDRLVSLGRNSAIGRVAALLLWIRDRLKLADPACDDMFLLPLTQEEIGDATGLTAVHVNRTMRALVEQGLVTRAGGRITLVDNARLARIANYTPRCERIDLGWLPDA